MPKNFSKEETEGKWITVRGRHILVKEGESVEDAFARSDKAMGKQSEKSKDKVDVKDIVKASLKTTRRAKKADNYRSDSKLVNSTVENYTKNPYVKKTILPAIEEKMKSMRKNRTYDERKVSAMFYNSLYACQAQGLLKSDSDIDSGKNINTLYWAADALEGSVYKKLFG